MRWRHGHETGLPFTFHASSTVNNSSNFHLRVIKNSNVISTAVPPTIDFFGIYVQCVEQRILHHQNMGCRPSVLQNQSSADIQIANYNSSGSSAVKKPIADTGLGTVSLNRRLQARVSFQENRINADINSNGFGPVESITLTNAKFMQKVRLTQQQHTQCLHQNP